MPEFELFLAAQQSAQEQLPWSKTVLHSLEPQLERGIIFCGKSTDFRLRYLAPNDEQLITKILSLASKKPQLCDVNELLLHSLAQKRLALVAEADNKGSFEFASYLASEMLDNATINNRLANLKEGMSFIEIRTSITCGLGESDSGTSYQGNGLNSIMKILQAWNLTVRTGGLMPVAVDESIPACLSLPPIQSEAFALNTKLGMSIMNVSASADKLKSLLVEPCPPKRCFLRGDAIKGQAICACRIYYFYFAKSLPATRIPKIDQIFESQEALV